MSKLDKFVDKLVTSVEKKMQEHDKNSLEVFDAYIKTINEEEESALAEVENKLNNISESQEAFYSSVKDDINNGRTVAGMSDYESQEVTDEEIREENREEKATQKYIEQEEKKEKSKSLELGESIIMETKQIDNPQPAFWKEDEKEVEVSSKVSSLINDVSEVHDEESKISFLLDRIEKRLDSIEEKLEGTAVILKEYEKSSVRETSSVETKENKLHSEVHEINNNVQEVKNTVSEKIEKINRNTNKILEDNSNRSQGFLNLIGNLFNNGFGLILKGFNSIRDHFKGFIRKFINYFPLIFMVLGSFAALTVEGFKKLKVWIDENITPLIKPIISMLEVIKSQLTSIWEALPEKWREGIKTTLKGVWAGVKGAVKEGITHLGPASVKLSVGATKGVMDYVTKHSEEVNNLISSSITKGDTVSTRSKVTDPGILNKPSINVTDTLTSKLTKTVKPPSPVEESEDSHLMVSEEKVPFVDKPFVDVKEDESKGVEQSQVINTSTTIINNSTFVVKSDTYVKYDH